MKEGGLIRDGFDAGLDELRRATREGKDWIAKLQQDEIERTGIASLKIRFNSVFGYYIEVTKSNLEKVPAHYTRKQTIANGERFVTPELKEVEGKILGAEERSVKLEHELFQRVREETLRQMPRLQQTAAALAQLDALGAFAETARLYNYCRPEIGDEGVLNIRDGRHPVLEQALSDERFVPNDTALDAKEQQLALITGPNMAGKSTFIRQLALDHVAGAHGFVGPGGVGADRSGGPNFHAHRGERRPGAGAIDVHGGDDRDGEHSQSRDRAEPGDSRRDRARDEHVRRP